MSAPSPPPDPAVRGRREMEHQVAAERHALEVHRDDLPGEDRILTVPNVITLVRLALLPVFVWLLLGQEDRGAAAWLLAGLGATDWIDGYIARRWHQVSTVGKILDPVADRLLFFVAIVCIIIDGSAPLWFCLAVLLREALVAGATLTLAALGAARIDVTWYGKAGTFSLMFAFPLFLAGASTMWWADQGEVMAWAFGIPGLILSYYAAALYVPAGIRALRDGRSARAG
jgi:cardiolipin synthase (CMP-forming)